MHGPGDQMWNIIIGQKSINDAMRAQVEWQALTRIYDLKQTLWYESTVEAYHPGAEFFAKSIRVRYGIYNPKTGAQGPAIVNLPFASSVKPPDCPPTQPKPKTPATIPPARKPAAPKPVADFTREIEEMCFRLETIRFPVKRGGLKVRFRTNLLPKSRHCLPGELFYVTLKRHHAILSDDEISTSTVPVGKSVTLTWRHLREDDDYYIVLSMPPWHNQDCCLTGDLSFYEFDAPIPPRTRRTRLPPIA
jgi:hypothetical protein